MEVDETLLGYSLDGPLSKLFKEVHFTNDFDMSKYMAARSVASFPYMAI
jgi:hypothetical protein